MSLPLGSWKGKQVGTLVMMSVRGGMHWDWKVYVVRGVKGNVKWKNRRLRVVIGVEEGGGVCCNCCHRIVQYALSIETRSRYAV
jgi:hypothetical protein